MVNAFVPQHLIDLAEYLKEKEFSDKNYDLQCINRTIVNRAYLSTYLHTQEWIVNNGHTIMLKIIAKRMLDTILQFASL